MVGERREDAGAKGTNEGETLEISGGLSPHWVPHLVSTLLLVFNLRGN